MATQPSLLDGPAPEPGGPGRTVDVDIAERMERSFLDYSMSVIVGRALPDVRDGLKPVQRRILYAMWEAGLRPDRPYRKCASAVGDVMKKYHPHGDVSIYETLVRMAQDFASRAPLIDGHGNFGSVDGDGAAAMRYTEARLSALAMELLDGIDEDTADLIPNYDGYEREPVVLPARFPNLLVNGASGIAVGMATNIPPHHLGETIAACRHLLVHPDASLDDLMRLVPAPDFPTGARILDTPAIREAYLTGRGAITMEAVATTETRAGGLPRIVITELPYQVNKALLLERIAELVRARKIEAIRDLRDESSRDGMRAVIELKRGEDPAAVLDALYRLTDMRTNFNVNMVALVATSRGEATTKESRGAGISTDSPQPQTLGLRDALLAYLDHQRVVITRRSRFRRERAAARAHVLEGLLIALDAIDEVVALIRAADSADEARTALMARFSLSEVQATAILDMQLRRLAALERLKLEQELAELRALIAELDRILGDPKVLDKLLDRELAAVATRHADARRSRLVGAGAQDGVGAATNGSGSALPAGGLDPQPVLLTVTAGGVVRAVAQRRVSPAHATARDALAAALRTTTAATLLVVGEQGAGHLVAAADVPVVTARQRGVPLAQLLGGRFPEGPASALVLDASWVVTVSAAGLVKRTAREELEGRARAATFAGVRPGDRIVAAVACEEEDQLLLAHDRGLVIRFPVAEVRPTGRGALGVAGLQVPKGGRVVAASVVADEDEVLTLGADGAAKRAPADEYPPQGRGGKGVRAGADALAWCGRATPLHVPAAGTWTVLPPETVPLSRRTARGAPTTAPVEGRVVAEWPPVGSAR